MRFIQKQFRLDSFRGYYFLIEKVMLIIKALVANIAAMLDQTQTFQVEIICLIHHLDYNGQSSHHLEVKPFNVTDAFNFSNKETLALQE